MQILLHCSVMSQGNVDVCHEDVAILDKLQIK